MGGTFLALTLWTIQNRFRTRFRRLREPRYLIGSIIGGAWFFFFVVRSLFNARPSGRHVPSPIEMVMHDAETSRFVIALALFAIALVIGLWPGARRPLEFSRAEVQFLFPAPITRRQLIQYKVLRSQLGLLFGAAIATLLFRPATLRDGWMFTVGVWLLLTVYRLYAIAIGLARGTTGGVRRQGGLLALLVAAVAVLGFAAASDGSHLAGLTTRGQVLEELRRIWSVGAAHVVLWPFRTLATLPFSGTPAAFAAALPGALLLAVIAYVAVLRADTPFEERSAADSAKGATKSAGTTAPKAQGRPAPFKLAPEGRPEIAILWKNLTLLGRFFSVAKLLRILPVLIVFAVVMGRGGKGPAALATTACLALAAMVVLIGPQSARNDLRQDLTKLAVLKTWPVSGRAIVRGELLAPTIVLSVLVCLLILAGALILGSVPVHGSRGAMLLAHRASYAAVAIFVAPSVILAQLVVANGIAVLFPAWMTLGKESNRGIESTGQQMLVTWGGFLASMVFLAPAAIGAGATLFAIRLATHRIVLVVPAITLAVLTIAQSWLVTGWLGRVFDRTDIGAVEAVEE